MYYKNFKYLISALGKTQKIVLSEFGYGSDAVVYEWKKGATPPPIKISRIANYFTRELNLPSDLLGNGQALLDTDIEALFTARGLPPSGSVRESGTLYHVSPDQNKPIDQISLSTQELTFLSALRKQGGSSEIPLSEPALQTLLELSHLTGGIGTNNQSGFTKALRGLRHVRETFDERTEDDPKSTETDKK